MELEVYEAQYYRSGDSPPARISQAEKKDNFPKLDTSVVFWLILFVFGGGLLALYYAGIGYFPEVTWQDALTYMALMTIIGGSLLVAYSFLLFVPGAIWSEMLIFDKHFHQRKVLMMETPDWEPCVWSVTKRIVFPFAIFMASSHFLLYLLDPEGRPAGLVAGGAAASLLAVSGLLARDFNRVLEGPSRRPESTLAGHRVCVGIFHIPLLSAFIAKASGHEASLGPAVLWAAAILPLTSFTGPIADRWIEPRRRCRGNIVARLSRREDETGEAAREPVVASDRFSLLCRTVLAFDSAALLSLTALWFFYRIYRGRVPGAPETVGGAPLSLLLLCTLVVIVTNLLVSVLFHEYGRSALLASFLAALLLLGAGQLLGTSPENTLPAKIMGKFGFGAQRATLVLKEKGGRILTQQGVVVTLEKSRPEDAEAGSVQTAGSGIREPGQAAQEGAEKNARLARIDDVVILSRLGSEYLLRFKGRLVTVPKEEVVSWSVKPEPEAAP